MLVKVYAEIWSAGANRRLSFGGGGGECKTTFCRQNIVASVCSNRTVLHFKLIYNNEQGCPETFEGLESLIFSSCSGLVRLGESGGILPRENFEI